MFTTTGDVNGQMGWIEGDIFGVAVERVECPRVNNRPYLPAGTSKIICLHTVEGTNLQATIDRFRKMGSAPTFVPGEGKLYQTRPLWARTGTLRANVPHDPNSQVQVQAEMLYQLPMSGNRPLIHLPPDGVLQPAIAMLAFCNRYLSIPLSRPSPRWMDDGSDITGIWASRNNRRVEAEKGLWPTPGIWQHLEVPWQQPTWHFDCGALAITKMIQMAVDLLAEYPQEGDLPEKPPQPAPHEDRPVLRPGRRDAHVLLLKRALGNFGLSVTDETDLYDVATLGLVYQFQTAHGLTPDGVVGPKTWASLLP